MAWRCGVHQVWTTKLERFAKLAGVCFRVFQTFIRCASHSLLSLK